MSGIFLSFFGGGSSLGPTSPADYPLLSGQYQVFSTEWSGSPANLPVSDTPTTFTVPSAAKGYVRVIVVGGASGGSSYQGSGAYVDALIPVSTGSRFKCIVGGGGATSSSSGRGGHGLGGGVGVDGNDTGSGGAGSGFFYAEPGATSNPSMFPMGVLIAGGGGGGNGGASPAGSSPSGSSTDTIGGFNGIFRAGIQTPNGGEPGQSGGIGGRFRNSPSTFNTPNAANGTGGTTATDDYGAGHGGGGGGAGAGGGGGLSGSGAGTTGEPATGDGGRGYGYGSYNPSGAGRGGEYPMRGGNGFIFNGVNLGGGGGGSHGSSNGGGGWGGGGGSTYNNNGGSGGSGAWGYVPGTASINGWTPSTSITVNGGNVSSVMSVPSTLGTSNGNRGYIVVMW